MTIQILSGIQTYSIPLMFVFGLTTVKCVSSDQKTIIYESPKVMPEDFAIAEKFYTEKVEKEATFSFDCRVSVEADQVGYMFQQTYLGEVVGWHLANDSKDLQKVNDRPLSVPINHPKRIYPKEELKYSVPFSFNVSGCGKREKYLLVTEDRKNICYTNYQLKQCIPVPASSFKRNVSSR